MRPPALPALLVLLTGALAQHPHTSRSGTRLLPLPRAEGVFHFIVFGDRTGGPPEGIKVLEQAVADTNLLGPDLVMTVGDLVQGYNRSPQWLEQMREFRGAMNKLDCPWFPVAGNHDVYWRGEGRPKGGHETDYEKHFGPLWYWFAHKNCAFFVLYTDEGDPKDNSKGFQLARHTQMSQEQMDWLDAELRKVRDKDHVFVFVHHPRWIEGRYKGTNWDRVHKILKKAGNVTAVFGGHIHRMHYAGKRDGIDYLALATTGGAKAMDFPYAGYVHHFNVVTVRKDRVRYATIPVGTVIDPKRFTPEHLAAAGRLRSMKPRSLGAPLEVDAHGACLGAYVCEIANPTTSPIEVTAIIRTRDHGWLFAPDHVHLKVGPNATRKVEIGYAREGKGFATFDRPRVALQLDWLLDGRRITIPENVWNLPLRLTGVPVNFFDPLDSGALSVSRGSCVRIDAATLRLPDGPMTVEAWCKPRRLAGRRALVAKTESSEYGIFVSNGQPDFSVHLGGEYRGARGAKGALVTGRWQHVAGVFDGREVRLYVGGKIVARGPAAGHRTTSDKPLFIGADPNPNGQPVSFFDGLIDEVRISSSARYAGNEFEPAARHEPDDKTLLLLHFDKDLGPFEPDHSAGGRHGYRLGKARCVHIDKGSKR